MSRTVVPRALRRLLLVPAVAAGFAAASAPASAVSPDQPLGHSRGHGQGLAVAAAAHEAHRPSLAAVGRKVH